MHPMVNIHQVPKLTVQRKEWSYTKMLPAIVFAGAILYFGRSLFIPLSFAVLVSFILYPVCIRLEKKGVNASAAIAISLVSLILVGLLLAFVFITQIHGFLSELNDLKPKFWNTMNSLSVFCANNLNLDLYQQNVLLDKLQSELESQVIPFLKITALSFSYSIILLVLIPVFAGLLLFYRKTLVQVLYNLFPTQEKGGILNILRESVHSYYKFIKGMLMVYLIVGILNAIGLAVLGIPHPVLFGFAASVLTFIPYVGIMIASLLPISVAWITFNSIWYPVGVIVVFSLVQLLEAYIIFPFAVGTKLNINMLVLLVVIIAGGILWGAAGTILFVPFIGIIKLIADRTEKLKTLSLLLSAG